MCQACASTTSSTSVGTTSTGDHVFLTCMQLSICEKRKWTVILDIQRIRGAENRKRLAELYSSCNSTRRAMGLIFWNTKMGMRLWQNILQFQCWNRIVEAVLVLLDIPESCITVGQRKISFLLSVKRMIRIRRMGSIGTSGFETILG